MGDSNEVYFLKQVETQNYSKDFVQNLSQVNNTLGAISKYLISMQKGIDEANMDILQKIQAFIDEIIIIFTGGEIGGDTGFRWGDLGYIIQALGALFGFQGGAGPINLFNAAAHFLEGFGGGIINGFIKAVFKFFASLLSNVPIVGESLEDIVNNMADGINTTHSTATAANSTANTANNTANQANQTANQANQTANGLADYVSDAQAAATAAANLAAQADQKADIAYKNAQHWKDEFIASAAGIQVQLGINDIELGCVMDLPDDGIDRIRKITAVRYGMKANASTQIVIQLRKTTTPGNVVSVIHSTTINGGATRLRDNTPDITMADGDYVSLNVLSITPPGAVITGLQAAIIGVLIEAP